MRFAIEQSTSTRFAPHLVGITPHKAAATQVGLVQVT
jgi:hypothetical protein